MRLAPSKYFTIIVMMISVMQLTLDNFRKMGTKTSAAFEYFSHPIIYLQYFGNPTLESATFLNIPSIICFHGLIERVTNTFNRARSSMRSTTRSFPDPMVPSPLLTTTREMKTKCSCFEGKSNSLQRLSGAPTGTKSLRLFGLSPDRQIHCQNHFGFQFHCQG